MFNDLREKRRFDFLIKREEKEEVKLLVITVRRDESFRVNQMFVSSLTEKRRTEEEESQTCCQSVVNREKHCL